MTRAEGIDDERPDQWPLVVSWALERYVASGACSRRRCQGRMVVPGDIEVPTKERGG
jgi:hypothetical protein